MVSSGPRSWTSGRVDAVLFEGFVMRRKVNRNRHNRLKLV
jgi:hypothetical protein